MTEPQSADAEPARKCTDKTRRVAMSPFESNDALRRAERSWHDGVTFAKALRSPPAAALEKVECPLWVGLSRVLSLSISDVGLQRSDCYRIEMTTSPVSSSSSLTLEPVGGIASAFATETIAMDPS